MNRLGIRTRIIFRDIAPFHKSNLIQKIIFNIKIIYFSINSRLIIFHKYVPSISIQKLLRRKKIIFDFDDRIFNREILKEKKTRFRKFLKICHRIIVSVQSLKDELLIYFPEWSENIVVIPTLIDMNRISKEFRSKKKTHVELIVNIGWVGTSGGFKYLETIEEVLQKLLNDFKDKLIFTVISNKPFYPKNFLFLVENEKWLSKNEYRYFMDLDISVMPLNKSMRAQNKSGFKIIQSMACGIPVVASSVGFNKNIIEHGKNGFLADSPFEFYKYLKILILDRQLRLEMGRLAIESIKKFDYKNWEEFYLKQLFN